MACLQVASLGPGLPPQPASAMMMMSAAVIAARTLSVLAVVLTCFPHESFGAQGTRQQHVHGGGERDAAVRGRVGSDRFG